MVPARQSFDLQMVNLIASLGKHIDSSKKFANKSFLTGTLIVKFCPQNRQGNLPSEKTLGRYHEKARIISNFVIF